MTDFVEYRANGRFLFSVSPFSFLLRVGECGGDIEIYVHIFVDTFLDCIHFCGADF